VDFACSAPQHVSPAIAAGRMNVVVVVADDQGYCQYSFMAGACDGGARDGETCRSDVDCPNPNSAAPQACFTAADCVPDAVDPCQPLQLKVATSVSDGGTLKAWDIVWDPDQTRNLLDEKDGDPLYLGTANDGLLGSRLDDCLEDYWTLAGPGERWVPPSDWRASGDASTCPWPAGE